mmetsp:Transcript_28205/g.38611  ORF Transcript_28205/g.38611 Transcript_28205/m.38611 type:complete len:117 (-) Transcript_28205:176-526(-)
MYTKGTIETGIEECGEGEPDQMINDNEPSYARRYGAAIGTGYTARLSQAQEARAENIGSKAATGYDGNKIQKLSGIFGFNGPGYERMKQGPDGWSGMCNGPGYERAERGRDDGSET